MGYDVRFFRAINGLAGRSDALDGFFIFCATDIPFLMIALSAAYVIVSWKTLSFKARIGDVAHAAWAVALGFMAEHVIGFLWFRPRPFASLPDVVQLVHRLPREKSFPSGHATFAFALAFGIALHDKKWGVPLLAMATLVSLGRVAAGVHYPSDILAGALLGFCAAKLAAPAKRFVEPYLELLADLRTHKKREAL